MTRLFYLLILFLYSCEQTAHEQVDNKARIKIDTPDTFQKQKEKSQEESSKEIRERDKSDNIQLNTMMKDILKIAEKNKTAASFQKDLKNWDYDVETSANLTFGHLFSTNKKHLIVRRFITASFAYIDIFLLDKSKFRLVFSRMQDGMTYIDDTIRDVNGDNLNDFLVHWYPSSGCCRRNVYNVYLYQPDKGTFTSDYRFINPTFSPKEKIIRGVGYGHPGEVELYKYKWNGLQVDTLEFIHPNREDTIGRSYFKTKKHLYSSTNIQKTKLKSVPKEYAKIESYEWFQDY